MPLDLRGVPCTVRRAAAGQPAQAPAAPKPNLPDKPDTSGIEPVAVLKQRPLLKDVPIERGPQPVPPYIGRIPGIVDDRITALAYSPDGSHMAIGTFYGHIVIYAAADIEKLAKRQQAIAAVK